MQNFAHFLEGAGEPLYLRDLTAPDAPTAGEKSTALPNAAATNNSGATFEDLSLLPEKGTSQVTRTRATDGNPNHQDQYIARFTSQPLLGTQTVLAQNWRIGIAVNEANAAANSQLMISFYVWRPGTSAVVGYIYDSHTVLGTEWSATEDGVEATFPGNMVVCQEGDVIVLEVWRHTVGGA